MNNRKTTKCNPYGVYFCSTVFPSLFMTYSFMPHIVSCFNLSVRFSTLTDGCQLSHSPILAFPLFPLGPVHCCCILTPRGHTAIYFAFRLYVAGAHAGALENCIIHFLSLVHRRILLLHRGANQIVFCRHFCSSTAGDDGF